MPIFKVKGIYKILLITRKLILVYNKKNKTLEKVIKSRNESKYNYLLTKDTEFYTLSVIG